MNQHEAATAIARALHASGFHSVRTVRPLAYKRKRKNGPTVVLADVLDSDLSSTALSVTVEILAQP